MTHEALYSVEREYPVPVKRLWRAWTDPAELEQWYSPVALAVVPGSVVSDVKLGGHWKSAVDVPEHAFVAYFWGRFSDVVPERRLEHSLFYSQEEAEFVLADESGEYHVISVDFEPRGEQAAWVRFSQFGNMPAEQVEATQLGMESYFDNLERYLESNPA